MFDELIKKYEEKIKHNNQIQQKLIDECMVYASDLANDNEICEEILQDLKELNNNIGNLSDGYHTFNELYEFRKIYNACLFNEWYKNNTHEVYKSKRHHDNEECFGGGWFIVVAILPTGQISNHYELKDWDLFNISEYEKSKYEFDGHTPNDVLERLKSLGE